MRWLLLVGMLGVLGSASAHAKCMSYAETLLTPVVPPGTPLIVFEVFSFAEDEIPSDLTQVAAQVTLVSVHGKKVEVTVRATHRGMRQWQIELVPQTPLTPGTYRVIRATRPEGMARESHTLKVVAAGASPVMTAPTVVASASVYERFGCGPGESIDVTLAAAGPYFAAATSDAPRYAFVTLLDRAGGAQSGYLKVGVAERGLALSIGHGMCSGEFQPIAGHHYTATLQLVAPDGARGPATTTELDYLLNAPAPE